METVPERIRPPTEPPAAHSSDLPNPRAPLTLDLSVDASSRAALRRARVLSELRRLAPLIAVYAGTRLLLIIVAAINGAATHHALHDELANWDGLWYRELVNKGYPTHVTHTPSTLGFFPLFPMAMWLVSRGLGISTDAGGFIIATTGGSSRRCSSSGWRAAGGGARAGAGRRSCSASSQARSFS